MKRILRHITLVASLLLILSCERRPMYDATNNLILDIELDLDIEREVDTPSPSKMRAVFYHPIEHYRRTEAFTGPTGGEIYVDPDSYKMLVYNFDTKSTHVREESRYHTIEAFTNEVMVDERRAFELLKRTVLDKNLAPRNYLYEKVIYEPDHLFVANLEDVKVPMRVEGEPSMVIHAKASSMVEVYTLTIGPIKGDKNIAKATVYLTGQVPSKKFATGTITGEPSTIYFPIDVDGTKKHFFGVFHTFGKYPGADNKVFLIVDIVDTAGGRHMWEWDVTDQFDGGSHDIDIENDLEIPTPQGESTGFDPTVTLWDETITNLEI